MSLKEFFHNRWVRFGFWAVLYVLWIIWLESWWWWTLGLVAGLAIIFDLCVTKKVKWLFWKKEYKEGETFCHIQAKWGEIIPVPAALGGKVVEIVAKQGKPIRRGDTIAWIEREK